MQNMIGLNGLTWADCGRLDLLQAGHVIEEPTLLFEKIEDDVIQLQLDKLEASKQANLAAAAVAAPAKSNIQFDDFVKMDIRVGTIIEAEKVAKTKKLMKLKVDTGIDQRTVVSGIAEFFSPEEIIGKQVSISYNFV